MDKYLEPVLGRGEEVLEEAAARPVGGLVLERLQDHVVLVQVLGDPGLGVALPLLLVPRVRLNGLGRLNRLWQFRLSKPITVFSIKVAI